MSFRTLTTYGGKICCRKDNVGSCLFGTGRKRNHAAVVSSATAYFQEMSTKSSSQMFRLEGIQGPTSSPLSLHDSKKILTKAAKQASAGFSLQGAQGSGFHTEPHLQTNSKVRAKFDWELDDSACPQGIQGTVDTSTTGCPHFQAWLDSCRRYGLANCDQQLQGIQSGRLTLAQVLAEQEALIAKIAESYSKRVSGQEDSVQSAQENVQLPDMNTPCPQGVQGDECVRFKLWLENCHRFGFHECADQLQGFQNGRITLGQIFLQQEETIRQVVQQYEQRRNYSAQPRPQPRENEDRDADDVNVDVTTAQVGETVEQKLSQRERLKRAIKEYGSTVIVFHITISLASLGGFYVAVSSGIDMVSMLKSIGIGEAILQSKLATGTGTFVVAYAVHKVFAPVRIATTLTATPFIVRYLRRIGFLKPPKKVL